MRRRILIAEEDHSFAETLQKAASRIDCKVIKVSNHHEVIENTETQMPSLIILSADMGGSAGYSVCNIIKKNSVLRKIPLVLTIRGDSAEKIMKQHSILKTRADAYLPAPCTENEVLHTIKPMLESASEKPNDIGRNENVAGKPNVDKSFPIGVVIISFFVLFAIGLGFIWYYYGKDSVDTILKILGGLAIASFLVSLIIKNLKKNEQND